MTNEGYLKSVKKTQDVYDEQDARKDTDKDWIEYRKTKALEIIAETLITIDITLSGLLSDEDTIRVRKVD